ncbi:hypothetical protein DHD08_18220 [Arenibacter sp. H213]|nr:hypothetical protein [Arenibacter sp. H213]
MNPATSGIFLSKSVCLQAGRIPLPAGYFYPNLSAFRQVESRYQRDISIQIFQPSGRLNPATSGIFLSKSFSLQAGRIPLPAGYFYPNLSAFRQVESRYQRNFTLIFFVNEQIKILIFSWAFPFAPNLQDL